MGSLDYDYPVIDGTNKHFYLPNKNKIKLLGDNKYLLKDRKLKFFYYRFVENLGNIKAIKNSITELIIDEEKISSLISNLRSSTKKYKNYLKN